MPHSLRVRLKNLQRKGELTEKDIDRIFKALEQEPCDDVVSRQAIMKLKRHNLVEGQFVSLYDIERLPSVRPQEQTGHWILLDECANNGYYCSNCQKKLVKEGWSQTVKKIKYCPNCGAKMIEPQESEDKE